MKACVLTLRVDISKSSLPKVSVSRHDIDRQDSSPTGLLKIVLFATSSQKNIRNSCPAESLSHRNLTNNIDLGRYLAVESFEQRKPNVGYVVDLILGQLEK